MTTELPEKWDSFHGEASRPLHEGGYYQHTAARVLWANQHKEVYAELTVDTVGSLPRRHVVVLDLREEDDTESRDLARLHVEHIDVETPDSEESQREAERIAHEQGVEMAEALERGEYDAVEDYRQ